jgi:UDP-N-acetylmuramoyl-tripeptide--D-alanyl-D-alanine ligase
MLAAILREAVRGTALADETDPRVLATRGNLNNDLGVPLTLLELTAARRYAVVELGMNHAGEIRDLAQLAAPQVALVTNAGSAHLGLLGSLEAIALAKGEIYEALGSDGTAVINADDAFAPLWRKIAAEKPVLDFGLTPEAAVSASYTLHQLESEIVVKTPLGEAPFLLRAPGLHNVRNAAAAAAAATALDLTPDIIAAGLTRYRGVKGRLQQKTAINGAVLIDDTYNANPESVRAAIAVLAQVPGRRILVLGDMGELGPDAERLHVEVGDAARLGGVDRLYALGELAAKAVEAFGPGATHFARIEDLLAAVENELAPRVTVLVKGSRFMRMERVVAAFEAREDE